LKKGIHSRDHYTAGLWLLTGLFALRVSGQFVQSCFHTDWLPAFEQWQGSRLPYPLLLTIQGLILVIQCRVNFKAAAGSLIPTPPLGLLLLVLGAIYFITMAIRLAVGLSLYPEHPWFGKWIPALFHLVLASYLLLLGRIHLDSLRTTV